MQCPHCNNSTILDPLTKAYICPHCGTVVGYPVDYFVKENVEYIKRWKQGEVKTKPEGITTSNDNGIDIRTLQKFRNELEKIEKTLNRELPKDRIIEELKTLVKALKRRGIKIIRPHIRATLLYTVLKNMEIPNAYEVVMKVFGNEEKIRRLGLSTTKRKTVIREVIERVLNRKTIEKTWTTLRKNVVEYFRKYINNIETLKTIAQVVDMLIQCDEIRKYMSTKPFRSKLVVFINTVIDLLRLYGEVPEIKIPPGKQYLKHYEDVHIETRKGD